MSNYTNRSEIRQMSKSELHRVISGLYNDLKKQHEAVREAHDTVEAVKDQAAKLMEAMRQERMQWQQRVDHLSSNVDELVRLELEKRVPMAVFQCEPGAITKEHVQAWKDSGCRGISTVEELYEASKELGVEIINVNDTRDPIPVTRRIRELL